MAFTVLKKANIAGKRFFLTYNGVTVNITENSTQIPTGIILNLLRDKNFTTLTGEQCHYYPSEIRIANNLSSMVVDCSLSPIGTTEYYCTTGGVLGKSTNDTAAVVTKYLFPISASYFPDSPSVLTADVIQSVVWTARIGYYSSQDIYGLLIEVSGASVGTGGNFIAYDPDTSKWGLCVQSNSTLFNPLYSLLMDGATLYLSDGYFISYNEGTNGSVSGPNISNANTVVNVTFTPDSGYVVDWDNVTITTDEAGTVLIKDTETTGHFTMPAGDVTINPAFTRALTAGVQVSGGNGTATVSNSHPNEGDTVTITCYPNNGYEVDTVTAFDATIRKVATNIYEFTMPNVDVLATVTFKESTLFTVTVEPVSNGTVTASPTSGYAGTTINLTVTPNSGFSLKHLYVLAGTDSVATQKIDDTHYYFTLPSFNIVVRTLFTDGDPYSPGGNSQPSPEGGTGSFDNGTMPITPPAIPSVSVTDIGLYTIFSLSQSELNGFTNYLWSNLFSLETVSRYLNNATENILSLHILPFSVSAGLSREIRFMGIGTGVNGSVATNQFQHIDCGSVLLEEYYGSALDYNPWTKILLYVPYCGEVQLDPDEVMGKAIRLQYTLDILTGNLYANVSAEGTTLYQLSGNCAMQLPVSASNWSRVLTAARSAFMLAAGVGAAAMGAVGAGLVSAGYAANQVAIESGNDRSFDDAVRFGTAGRQIQEMTPEVGTTNSYMATMAQKSNMVHTGLQNGSSSFMAVQVPYLLIKRPRQSLPENMNKYVGYPANYTRTIGNLSGFTQIVNWNPSSIPCTDAERDEITALMKKGVIV